ncbi:MAG TPA: hypothetical protein EYP85_02010 [Armatimonadetes bacterium]|nr:hypothetical protein [Armatimonadota bacterium]
MKPIRYTIVGELPPEVTSPDFVEVHEGEMKVKLLLRGDEIVVVTHADQVHQCEALLRSLGATEIGVDLCG